jgi:hypothetical protein
MKACTLTTPRRLTSTLAVTAVAAGSLVAAAGTAAKTHGNKTSKSKTVKVKPPAPSHCWVVLSTQVPTGQTAVSPPVDQGTEAGTVACSGRHFGRGVRWDTFSVGDSGDIVGTSTWYLPAGTLKGAFDLVPTDNATGGANFAELDSGGTLTITGGTGVFAHAKGTGTASCISHDQVHTYCTETVKLTQL